MINWVSLKVIILISAGISTILGLLVLMGWHTGNTTLIQVLPTFVPMQYNTALGFLLCGLTLVSLQYNKVILSIIPGLIIGLIASLTLVEYLFTINIGIDQMLMKHDITVETSDPGRMAPNTAIGFLLIPILIFLSIGNLKKVQISGALSSFLFGLGLVSFVGYLIGMEVTYGWGQLTSMAIHTAFGFVVIAIGFTAVSWVREHDLRVEGQQGIEHWLAGYAIALTITIFFIDLSLPLGIAAGVPYIVLVLLGWFIKKHRVILILAGIATVFTILGYFFSEQGSEIWMVITNRCFALIAIWVVAVLLYNIKRKELALKEANLVLDKRVLERTKELEVRNRELEQFAYIASHDLQEPLSTVTNFTKMFASRYADKFDDTGAKSLKFIIEATGRMGMLIKGLLDYSRIGRDQELIKIDLKQLVNEVLLDFSHKIKEKDVVIELGKLPVIKGYRTELGSLFQNLISNAIKFNKKDITPIIKITANKDSAGWVFAIEDNGIGIEPCYQEKVFVIFQRLHTRNEYKGTGIGLAHYKKIVELHKGDIWIESDINKGSTFYFTIPTS